MRKLAWIKDGLVATATIAVMSHAVADSFPSLQEEIRWLKEEHYVTTATKTLETLKKSGSTMSVITADDLQKMGARNLMDALKRVPGFGINRFNMGTRSLEVRGVKTDFSEKVLFLINGHPINNNLVNGGALSSYNNFRIDDIKVIEVVRGPGSALYGANAFVAVVNIVTKSANDVNGTQLSVAGGSYETNQLNLLHGGQVGNVDVAVNLNMYHSNGWKGEVERDDHGNSGTTDYWQKRYEVGFQAAINDFSIQGRYVQRKAGDYLGAFSLLNAGSKQEYQEYFLEGSYQYAFDSQTQLMAKLYFDHFQFDNLWEFTPAGNFVRSPVEHDKLGGEAQVAWDSSDNNKLLVGVALEHQSQYNVELWANGGSGPLLDISDVANWNGSHNRNIFAVYAQDIWDIKETLRLIAGARYDRYSDFGGTFNPRASVSWEFAPDYQLVATYGSAFRAPTFGELYNTNNNSIVGNPNLNPEEIDTYELGVNVDINRRSKFHSTLFYNEIDNIIAPDFSENIGELAVLGIELEFDTRLSDGSSIGLNYTYQDPTNKVTDTRAPEVPLHRANAMYRYRFSRYIDAFVGVLYESTLSRDSADPRADVPELYAVDLALTWRNQSENIRITASIYNALDEDLVDPSRISNNPEIFDFPAPGRNFMLELQLIESAQ
jgi:outer membrane cobalamin receptor